ncbi:MAG: aminoglycoside 3'-phosphotransferase/choline kinase family protein [Bacilli bacterium]|nr:aminoglycoside 3'-phosphotransferase/choline kinase family protein [Bacilli bacterium]
MYIKTKRFINEGFNSKAYIINDDYILLEGVNKNSYNNYLKYVESIKNLKDIKSVQIPNIVELISPNDEFENGAMIYKMIKGHTFKKEHITKVDLDNIAKSIANFTNELYNIKVPFDKKGYVDREISITERSVNLLKKYLSNEEYRKVLDWFKEYKNYLLSFNDYHYIHGDLWYENYILDDNDNLIGIVDFEGACMGDPAYDIAALYYLGDDFVAKVLKYYKYTNNDLIKRVSMLIKAREIADFEDMINNYPEEVEEQVDKIGKVLN